MRWPLVGILAVTVVGCADTPSAPIEDRTGGRRERGAPIRHTTDSVTGSAVNDATTVGESYTVKKGDTLFSIAFSLNLPMEQLAALNTLAPPYAIYPGQVLNTALSRLKATQATVTVQPGDTLYGIARSLGLPMQSLIDINQLSAPYSLAVGQVLRTRPPSDKRLAAGSGEQKKTSPTGQRAPATTATSQLSTPAVAHTSAQKTPSPTLGPVSRWRWPSGGRLVRGYSSNLHKGIDIAGQRGDSVRATARGVVVYAGTGVKGYGALIIVKHNDDYLSAYGHNDAILVSEGDVINDAQVIARMGSTGTDRVKLHFEIRRQGKPIDPVKVLPRR